MDLSRPSSLLLGIRRLAILLSMAIGLQPPASSAQIVREVAAPMLLPMVEAEEALRQNEPQLAESRYRTALQEGWMLIGALDVAENELHGARSAYEAALASAVDTRLPMLSLATIDLKLGDPEKAIIPLRRMISMNSMDHQARKLLARALSSNGQIAESVQELKELRLLFPEDLENLFALASARLNQEDLETAETLFNELAAKRPIPATQVLIGRTYRDFDRWDHAREALNKALEMDPQIRRAHYYLGTVEIFERGTQGIDDAVAQFRAELEGNPDDPLSNTFLGMALVEARREQEAVPHLESASRHPGTERQALHYLGVAYLRAGRAEDAVPCLRRSLELLELTPVRASADLYDRRLNQIAQLNYQLGRALRQVGDTEAASLHFNAAEEYSETHTEDSRERLRQFLNDEPLDQAQGSVESPLESSSAADMSPEEREELRDLVKSKLAQAYLNLGVLMTQAQRVSRAVELFRQAATIAPDYPQVQYALGIARFNSGQFTEATDPLSRALELDPSNADLKRMLALAWLNSDQYEEAVELLRNDEERKSNRSLQYAYGLALVRSGRAVEAQLIFADLLTKYPDWAELNLVLGQAAAQQDDYPAAIEALNKAIELQPDVAEAHLNLGEIYLRKGELDAAERELRAELESHPDDSSAQYLLAVVLDLAGKSTEAMELLESLIEKTPHSSNARYLMGKILLAEGDVERAQIQLESATRLDPRNPEAHYQLGIALQRLGRRDEAKQAFDTFQALKRKKGS